MQQYDVTVYADFGPIGTPSFTYRVSAASLDEASGAALALAQERNPGVQHFTIAAPEPVDDDQQPAQQPEEEEPEETEEETEERASRRFDPVSRITWLDFAAKPEEATRAALKAHGWRWSGYRKEWYTNQRYPQLPAGVVAEDDGTCDYASERADRLTARADRHRSASDAAYKRSNDLVSMIPLGQPILVGHHSERADRNRRAKSWRAMDKSVEEAKTADRLSEAARSSAAHQAYYTTNPDALQRRVDRLSAEARKMARTVDARTRQLAQRGEEQTDGDREYLRRLEAIESEIADLRQRIAAAGGITADRLAAAGMVAEVGDLVRIHGFTGVVRRVNPKSYTVEMRNGNSGDGWTLKLDRTRLQAILRKHDDMQQKEERPEQAAN